MKHDSQKDYAVHHEAEYLHFIEKAGVGEKDVVASSPKRYVGWLRIIACLLGRDITPKMLRSKNDVVDISEKLKGQRAPKTLSNYRSVMRKYVEMVETLGL